MTGSISGTCGFYQGSLSNVVYSQAFSGDGTFCTGFAAGGAFTNTGILQIGDIFALAHNTISASAPVGYGVFVDFNTTYQITQQYILNSPTPPTTATGFFRTAVGGSGTTDDGTGLGSCSEGVTLNVGGVTGSAQTDVPITFGQPITISASARVTCNDYGGVGRSFGDDGFQQLTAIPIVLYDANGNVLGAATLDPVPEPRSYLLIGLLGVPFVCWRRLRSKKGLHLTATSQIFSRLEVPFGPAASSTTV